MFETRVRWNTGEARGGSVLGGLYSNRQSHGEFRGSVAGSVSTRWQAKGGLISSEAEKLSRFTLLDCNYMRARNSSIYTRKIPSYGRKIKTGSKLIDRRVTRNHHAHWGFNERATGCEESRNERNWLIRILQLGDIVASIKKKKRRRWFKTFCIRHDELWKTRLADVIRWSAADIECESTNWQTAERKLLLYSLHLESSQWLQYLHTLNLYKYWCFRRHIYYMQMWVYMDI